MKTKKDFSKQEAKKNNEILNVNEMLKIKGGYDSTHKDLIDLK